MTYKSLFLIGAMLIAGLQTKAEDGSRLWLRFDTNASASVQVKSSTPTLDLAARELRAAWQGAPVRLVIKKDRALKAEGFRISRQADGSLVLTSPSEKGILYGTYHLLRMQETQALAAWDKAAGDIIENPAYDLRILNHWDNPDGTIERGYAGRSLWQWDELPATLSPRYEAYARANASIGINATVLNNVNASPSILRADNLDKVRALADLFRPYGIRVYLSVNFASPMVLDSLPTADPLNKEVQRWWKRKAKEIYRLIPDFGGFLVKANSEGQPGPCDYQRTHAQGANLLADALRPYGGLVMWRAFVYSPGDADRAKQAYQEFMPLDGQFRDNVIIQTKNGPIDFQPREPYSPLFTGLTHTAQMVEFQVTQEYLGHANHVAFLAPMWREFFRFVRPESIRAVAGVANIGTDTNWCGHDLAQANWYAFGRLAWNPAITSEQIAREWSRQTFFTQADTGQAGATAEKQAEESLVSLLLNSRETVVDYMMPLGLHHIFAWGHHYGPEPWCEVSGARPDWLPTYYHRADAQGLGFDRSHTGSNATAQYPDSLCALFDDLTTCPEEFLLWFHHVPWTHQMRSGRTLWQELCYRYSQGVEGAREMQRQWDALEGIIDTERFRSVRCKLMTQTRDAQWWKDACLLYFQTFSGQPFPADMERPVHTLDALKKIHLPIDNYTCPDQEMLDKLR